MKPTTTVKSSFMPPLNLARIAALVAVGSLAFALAPAGCIGGWAYGNVPEGDRCNPYDSHNECKSGLACTVSAWQVANQGTLSAQGNTVLFLAAGAGVNGIDGGYDVLAFCPENYCCPVDSNGDLTPSSNPNCQPGCNGGASSICTSLGNTTAPYVGVCDFANTGVFDDAGSDAGPVPDAGDGGTSAEASVEASTPDAAPDATPDATPDAAPDASTDGSSAD